MFKKTKLIAFLLAFSFASLAQNSITGIVLNQETMVPIADVHIKIYGYEAGTTTNPDGTFILKDLISSKVTLEFTALSFKKYTIDIKLNNGTNNLGTILLENQPYSLDEISINAGLSIERDLPISVSSISSNTINNTIGDRPLPLIMQNTPGVFSVRDGGGSGDSRLSIRGFHQENVSLLLNGIPINGEENGLVYWSNWLGLSSSAAEIQIQKGAGVANASIYSVGGTVNIITKNTQQVKSGAISFNTSSYGNINTNIVLNSGLLKSGWNASLMIGLGKGLGYIDATYMSSFSYFFNATKQLTPDHKITITLLGAPQRHGQRTLKLSNEEVNYSGLKFNKDWGGFNGKIKNASENFYHKPFLSINDEYRINDRNLISTSVYFSVGHGGGRWSESFNYAPSIFSYRDNAGQIAWNRIYDNNSNHEQSYNLDNGETVSGYSINAQTNFLASHLQTGIMSNYELKLNDKMKFLAGVHYRYFNSFVREEIDDLMGGKFFIEDYSWSLAGVAGRNQIKTVGDIIKVDNNTLINFLSTWAQLVYNTNRFNAYVSGSFNNNWYQRIDRFNYIDNTKSEVVYKPGFDIRAGIIGIANENNRFYFNGSIISKAPYFKYVFGNFTNVVVQDLKNETAKSIELGYKLDYKRIKLNLTGYITERENVSLLTNEYVQLENSDQTRAMVTGLNSLNKGLELDFSYTVSRSLKLGIWGSMGSFKWQNNVSASLFNDNNVVVDTVNVFVKDLYIGGTAQNQVGIFADFVVLKTLYFKTEYQYFDGVYADFDPTIRSNPMDMSQSYRFPSYGVFNAFLGIPFSFSKFHGRLQINAFNIINTKYIVLGEDGMDHDLNTFRGFWSFGRNLTFGLTLNF